MLILPDGTLFVQILNFVVFWMLLNFFFIRPTQRKIDERLRHVARQYEEADASAAQSAAIMEQASGIVRDAARRAEALMREAAGRAAKETSAIEKDAVAQAATATENARATVAAERDRAQAAALPLIGELAREMVTKAMGPAEMARR
ncbi:MAG: ATP synthase F0 subunit B [Candidatus Eremiobacteraeota bacterium]|nr:ATP synthase F0 subunit B [Candidatus Eremiobacteraeota bacterium]MBC5828388.1 ATP synthase F0 subunit B [Candidatus Eremiobacteraeota bacterium]